VRTRTASRRLRTCVSRSERPATPPRVAKAGLPSEAPRAKEGGFAQRLLSWHRRHGRRDLPWLGERDPYRVWISEIMLQQTQVATALPYFRRFIERFPDVRSLARAPIGDAMALWAGLGYYARARNLHACACAVEQRHDGCFPRTAEALAKLPGIGRSTAGAIAAFCFDERAPVLDGNVKRVLARHWTIEGDPRSTPVARRLWDRAQLELPPTRQMARYTQAIMDLGATVCTRTKPACNRCPLKASCRAYSTGRTGELPAPRARRERPVRPAHVLIALAGQAVLLQRRKTEGIWGGLMCLPEFGSRAALLRRARVLGVEPVPAPLLAPRQHALTHLTLTIEPVVAAGPAVAAHDVDARHWVALDRIDQAGLPAPHRALLCEVQEILRVYGSPVGPTLPGRGTPLPTK
jgi:A/G-specific adenine glycosylase